MSWRDVLDTLTLVTVPYFPVPLFRHLVYLDTPNGNLVRRDNIFEKYADPSSSSATRSLLMVGLSSLEDRSSSVTGHVASLVESQLALLHR